MRALARPLVASALGMAMALSAGRSSATGPYRMPWPPTLPMELTQDCNDSYFGDHVGSGKNAWDFANGTHFPVSVAREGIVTHLKMSSHAGCDTSACVDLANYVVVDHGDGTASVYLHLDGHSLDPAVRCGAPVRQGQRLALAGETGWATGPHLHFQVNAVHANERRECECGEDGLGCGDTAAAWSSFWSTARFPSIPLAFDEWPANECRDRRMVLPFSQNVETSEQHVASLGRGTAIVRGRNPRPLVVLGIGGRRSSALPLTDKSPPLFPEILGPSPPAPSLELPRP